MNMVISSWIWTFRWWASFLHHLSILNMIRWHCSSSSSGGGGMLSSNLLAGFFSRHCAKGPSIKCSEAPGYHINSGQTELMPQLINTKKERKEMKIGNTQERDTLLVASIRERNRGIAYLWGSICFNGSVLLHLPLSFSASRSFAVVENHGLLHSNHPIIGRVDVAWRARGLPVPWPSSPTGPPSLDLPRLSRGKEEPLLSVPSAHLPWKPCNNISHSVTQQKRDMRN